MAKPYQKGDVWSFRLRIKAENIYRTGFSNEPPARKELDKLQHTVKSAGALMGLVLGPVLGPVLGQVLGPVLGLLWLLSPAFRIWSERHKFQVLRRDALYERAAARERRSSEADVPDEQQF